MAAVHRNVCRTDSGRLCGGSGDGKLRLCADPICNKFCQRYRCLLGYGAAECRRSFSACLYLSGKRRTDTWKIHMYCCRIRSCHSRRSGIHLQKWDEWRDGRISLFSLSGRSGTDSGDCDIPAHEEDGLEKTFVKEKEDGNVKHF